MTTAKKTTAKKTTKKAATPKETTAKKRSTKTATATKVQETATEKVTVTMAPEAPETVEATVAETPVTETAQPEAKPVLTIGMFQKRLYERGYYGGHWDGPYSDMTKYAVARFQADNGLHPDGEPTAETLAKLGF